MNEEAILGGERVGLGAYEYHQREVDKLVKERDRMAGKVEIYRGITICLVCLILLSVFLNSCTTPHP